MFYKVQFTDGTQEAYEAANLTLLSRQNLKWYGFGESPVPNARFLAAPLLVLFVEDVKSIVVMTQDG